MNTTEPVILDINRRHDFVFSFDITDGNPNGDPDAGGLPRMDPETLQGLVTDVCVKRKVRNYVELTHGNEEGKHIYVQDRGIALNTLHQEAYDKQKMKSIGSKQPAPDVKRVREEMCATYYDVRTFGAVMTTQVNCGQVRGPIQITFSRSVSPIVPFDLAITRVAVTNPEPGKVTEIGRKKIIPYGLYVGQGYFVPHFAQATGCSQDDLKLFWTALAGAWEIDRAASRSAQSLRGLYVFSHENKLGNAPAHKLFPRIDIKPNEGVKAPRHYSDYTVTINDKDLPKGVTMTDVLAYLDQQSQEQDVS